MHISLIGDGEVGRILAEDLRAQDHPVRSFDLNLATPPEAFEAARTTLSPEDSAP